MNKVELATVKKVCSVVDAMTEFELRAFLRKRGVNFDGCPTYAVGRSSRKYESDWGNLVSGNNDVLFKDAHQKARDTGLNAVRRAKSDG